MQSEESTEIGCVVTGGLIDTVLGWQLGLTSTVSTVASAEMVGLYVCTCLLQIQLGLLHKWSFGPSYNLKDGIKCHALSNYDDGDDMQFAGTAL